MTDTEYANIKIAAVMSCPMLGWNPSWGCIQSALRPFKIPLRLGFGAFWHQAMQNMLEDCCDEGLDWVLTLDYDSMFTEEQLRNLIQRFGSSPNIDALAALQVKRGTDECPLLTTGGKHEIEITGVPLPVDTAHFGLTLFRLDALRKMPKPWFVGAPDKDGSYRTMGRVDPDIAFWRKWTETGNSVFVDPLVSIGHLQLFVSQYDDEFKLEHTLVPEWRKRNAK